MEAAQGVIRMPEVSTKSLHLVNDAAGHIISAVNCLNKVKEAEDSEALKSDITWIQRILFGIGKELSNFATASFSD